MGQSGAPTGWAAFSLPLRFALFTFMRLDLFLKATRLCLKRTVAQQLCDAGLVSVNGRAAKSAHAVKVDDGIVLRTRNKRLTIRVTKIPTTRSVAKSEATNLYELIGEEVLENF
jgi:ribosomal 50S subunit-recycling heat shock protein